MTHKTEDVLAWLVIILIFAVLLWGLVHFIGTLNPYAAMGTSLH